MEVQMIRKSEKGFTLIELMIVIAIIAIIAAIAIPNILGTTMAANEKSAMASLNSLGAGMESFKQDDVDRNNVQDYWTGNIEGLYIIIGPSGSSLTEHCKKISDKLAIADGYSGGATYTGLSTASVLPSTKSPHNGYWYRQIYLREQASGTQVAIDTPRDPNFYGAIAYPSLYGSTGKSVFLKSPEDTIYRRDGVNEYAVVSNGTSPPPTTGGHTTIQSPFNVVPFNKQSAGWTAVK